MVRKVGKAGRAMREKELAKEREKIRERIRREELQRIRRERKGVGQKPKNYKKRWYEIVGLKRSSSERYPEGQGQRPLDDPGEGPSTSSYSQT